MLCKLLRSVQYAVMFNPVLFAASLKKNPSVYIIPVLVIYIESKNLLMKFSDCHCVQRPLWICVEIKRRQQN